MEWLREYRYVEQNGRRYSVLGGFNDRQVYWLRRRIDSKDKFFSLLCIEGDKYKVVKVYSEGHWGKSISWKSAKKIVTRYLLTLDCDRIQKELDVKRKELLATL